MAAELPQVGGLWWVLVSLLGWVVGLISGLFGVGGGFLLVPVLTMAFGVPMPLAVGSSLCQIIGTGTAALVRHRRLGQGEIRLDWLLMGGSLLGVHVGAELVSVMNTWGSVSLLGRETPLARVILSLLYVALLVFIGLQMLMDSPEKRRGTPIVEGSLTRLHLGPMVDLPNARRRISGLLAAYLGLLLGLMSGLLGIGGGMVLLPILLYGIGMSIRMAAGTGVLLLVITSVVGTVSHAMKGNVHLGLAMALLCGSTIGAPMGAGLTTRIPVARLRRLLVVMVFITALAVLWNLVWGRR
jgi:uncharacterized membrane protein YfcA